MKRAFDKYLSSDRFINVIEDESATCVGGAVIVPQPHPGRCLQLLPIASALDVLPSAQHPYRVPAHPPMSVLVSTFGFLNELFCCTGDIVEGMVKVLGVVVGVVSAVEIGSCPFGPFGPFVVDGCEFGRGAGFCAVAPDTRLQFVPSILSFCVELSGQHPKSYCEQGNFP